MFIMLQLTTLMKQSIEEFFEAIMVEYLNTCYFIVYVRIRSQWADLILKKHSTCSPPGDNEQVLPRTTFLGLV